MLPCSATDSIKLYWNTLGVSPAIPVTNSITGYNPGVLGVTTSNSIESFLSGKTYEEMVNLINSLGVAEVAKVRRRAKVICKMAMVYEI